jgi:sulfur-oxidizing protein SoxY
MQQMEISRRQMLIGAAMTAVAVSLAPTMSLADAAKADAAIKKATGGKPIMEGRVSIEAPEIAENGNTVPVGVSVESPMSDADYVKALHVFAEGNPTPGVASFAFTPLSGEASVRTRMRMAGTQNLIAVAEMSDGSFYMGKREVKVTIGGCGG